MTIYVRDTRTGFQTKLEDATAAAAAAVAAHVAEPDPHTQYLTDAEGDAQYSQLGHDHSGVYAPTVHGHAQSDVTGLTDALLGKIPYLGVGNRDSLTLSYNPNTRKVTITGAAQIWINGVKTTLANPYEFTAHDNVTGGYFFYFNSSGVATVSSSPWSITTDAPICYVYYNASLVDGVAFYELHDARRNPELHARMHFVDGTTVENSSTAFTPSGFVLNSDLNADKAIAITAGSVWDEDIKRTTQSLPENGPYAIFWRTGASGVWTWTKTDTYPFKYGATNLQYNQLTGGSWQLTDITGNPEWINMWVFACTSLDSVFNFVFVVGQTLHTPENAAFNESISSISWGTMPFQEIAPLFQITVRRATSNNNIGKADIRRVARLVGTRSTISVGSSTHDPVTVTDSSTVDLALTNQALTASVITQMSVTSDASGVKLSGDAASPGNNKVYGTDGSGVKGWKNDPAGSANLSGLTDVTITTPADGEVLTYDTGTSKWINAASTGGGGGSPTTISYEAVTLSAVSQSSTYAGVTSASITNMTDGDSTTGTGTNNGSNEYIQVEWSTSKQIAGVKFGGGTIPVWGGASAYLNGKLVQYWNGSSWVDWFVIPGATYADTGWNQSIVYLPNVAPVTTTKLRLTWTGAGYVSTTSFVPYALVATGGGTGTIFTASSTAPTSPVNGDRWLDLDTGIQYTWVDDGSTEQWVEL